MAPLLNSLRVLQHAMPQRCALIDAGNEPDWSEGAQAILTAIQVKYGTKLKYNIRKSIVERFAGVPLSVWQEISSHLTIIRTTGYPPSPSARPTTSIKPRDPRLRPRPSCTDRPEPESSWPPPKFTQITEDILGNRDLYNLFPFENVISNGAPLSIWCPNNNCFLFLYIVRCTFTAVPCRKTNTWFCELKTDIGTCRASPEEIDRKETFDWPIFF